MKHEVFKYNEKTSTSNTNRRQNIRKGQISNNILEINKPNNLRTITILIIFFVIIIIGLAIFLTIYFVNKNKKPISPINDKNDDDPTDKPTEKPTNPILILEDPHIETEFEFSTKTKDLKRIYVNQKYKEDILIRGVKSEVFVDRKTNYDIFIISEEEPNKENENLYKKMYTAAIAIASECFSTKDENCEPQRLVDLSNTDTSELRNIEEVDDLKDLQIPLCLFNITDNDVITSITCPKALSEGKKLSMVLDLYFFRPPAIKRPEKEKANITITKEIKDNIQFIRETNGGICDVENAMNSFCTTDMNTTTDLKGNLITYSEVAFTNITNDENNYYVKNKISKLIDKTNVTNLMSPEKYEEALNKILPKLKPYMVFDEQFSIEEFKEMYDVSKNLTDFKNKKRNLNNEPEKPFIISEENLFSFDGYGGIVINLNLKDNIGLNTEAMEAFTNLKIEDENKELVRLKEYTDINTIIYKLIDLSKSGNNLATTLFNSLKPIFNNITNVIEKNISSLNNLMIYNELSNIFDSTLALDSLKVLPVTIIQESTNLKNNLYTIIENIGNVEFKNRVKVLNNDIYSYIRESHIKLQRIFENLKTLGKILSSEKSKLTEISTYYMNYTSSSYSSIIKEAKSILLTYYKKEKDLVEAAIDIILNEFEENLKESIEKEDSIINKLKSKIENNYFSIRLANNEDYKLVINNLYNCRSYITNIINNVTQKVKNEMDLKDSEYFISRYDIDSNNDSFTQIIDEALNIAKDLDNDEYIDKLFDTIMIQFKENFTSIKKYMDIVKEEEFPLNYGALKNGYFPEDDLIDKNIEIGELGLEISKKIKNENNFYLNELKKNIDNFIEENKEELNQLILNLTILFSEESLQNMVNLYEKALNSSIGKIKKEIKENKINADNYFINLENIIQNNQKLYEFLSSYHTDSQYIPLKIRYYNYRYFEDTISSKRKTQSYLTKYNTYKANFDYSKEYINEELIPDLLKEYKSSITKIREIFQSVKNNKISDKYPDFKELFFIDNHIRNIDTLYDRLNSYLSDDIFNNKYLNIINSYINNINIEIDDIKANIETHHNYINSFSLASDFTNDFCIAFQRKKTYTCTNGAYYYVYDSDNYCFPLADFSNNYNNLIKISIESDENLKNFNEEFNDFYSTISSTIDLYNSKIESLKQILSSSENKTLEQDITKDYLSPLKNKINLLLSEKFGDEIIKGSYNYYKSNIENKIGTILNNISSLWNESYELFKNNIDKNKKKFKNSITEFGVMAYILDTIIRENVTKDYFYSIQNHQKNEFNYTISYYYNYLIRIINSTHQRIINNIPINNNGFNNILEKRKEEINNEFSQIIETIKQSKSYALNFENQIFVLQVPSTNFFKINTILTNNQIDLENLIKNKALIIYQMSNGEKNNEFSLSARYYLENSESGKQIQEFFESIDNKIFVFLNLEQFNKLIIENWIIDQDEFINRLNTSLYNTNLDINNEFSNIKENYIDILENEIKKYFTKESIVEKINNLYQNGLKQIDYMTINQIQNYINETLNEIKNHIINEANRLKTSSNSYTFNFTKINKTINEYKIEFINSINSSIFRNLEYFYTNMIEKVYSNYVEKYLNEYIYYSNNVIRNFEEYHLLNSSYNLSNIIENIIFDLVEEYENITKIQIEKKYNDYYSNLKKDLKISDIENLVNYEINKEFYSNLYLALEEYAIYNPGDTGYIDYDFSQTIKNNIRLSITQLSENIENSMNITKGKDYNFDLRRWEILDFSNIREVLINIQNSFTNFISPQNYNEILELNSCLKEIIRSNFNKLLNNIIPSFGKEFFEKIIKYNENFKILTLYDNIKYSLLQTLAYYSTIKDFNSVKTLPKDLKLKLYTLNNLDAILENKNKQVLELLNSRIESFIQDSKKYIIRNYSSFLKEDAYINSKFSNEIVKKKSEAINEAVSGMEIDYTNLLNIYLKEKFLSSYTETINTQLNNMTKIIEEQKESLRLKIDGIFTLDPDSVLNEINLQTNITLQSINLYNSHFNSFKISDELKEYLNNFGNLKIKPSYESITSLLNEVSKYEIIKNLEKNSRQYENSINLDEFNNFSNNTYLYVKDKYIIY